MRVLSQFTGVEEKSISVNSPTAAEKIILFFTPHPLTAQSIRSLVLGSSPSVTFSIRFGPDVSQAGTEIDVGGDTCTNSTTGMATTALNNPAIPANSWVWLTTSATSGTVTLLHVTLAF